MPARQSGLALLILMILSCRKVQMNLWFFEAVRDKARCGKAQLAAFRTHRKNGPRYRRSCGGGFHRLLAEVLRRRQSFYNTAFGVNPDRRRMRGCITASGRCTREDSFRRSMHLTMSAPVHSARRTAGIFRSSSITILRSPIRNM